MSVLRFAVWSHACGYGHADACDGGVCSTRKQFRFKQTKNR